MPARPRKCCGKNSTLAPTKEIQKWSAPDPVGDDVAGHLREPVVPAREDREDGAERQHVVEVRNDVIGVLEQRSMPALARTTPVTPPTVNRKMKPIAHSIGALKSIEPPHIVAIQENTFTPVGTAITIVAKTK